MKMRLYNVYHSCLCFIFDKATVALKKMKSLNNTG